MCELQIESNSHSALPFISDTAKCSCDNTSWFESSALLFVGSVLLFVDCALSFCEFVVYRFMLKYK